MVEELKNIPLLILAGGKATRLRHLAANTAKYLMPISENKTFADLHLKWAKDQGFDRVILSLGYLAEQVQNYCGDGSNFGLKISYISDGDKPAGTGGAVRLALKENFNILAVTYGDTILSLNAKNLTKSFSRAKNSEALMTIYENKVPGHVCNCDFDGQYVKYDKSSPMPEWRYIDYGFMLLKRTLLENFSTQLPLDLANPLSDFSYKRKVIGSLISERFWEIGSPEALTEFKKHFGDSL